MRRHLLLLTFTLILSHFSILNLWAGDVYIFPVDSATYINGGTRGKDANGNWYAELTNSSDYVNIEFTLNHVRDYFVKIGYTTSASGATCDLEFYRYEGSYKLYNNTAYNFGRHSAPTSAIISEKDCGAQLDNGNMQHNSKIVPYSLRIYPTQGQTIRIYYLKLESRSVEDQSTVDIPSSLSLTYSSTVGDYGVISDGNFMWSDRAEGGIKDDKKGGDHSMTFKNSYGVTCTSRNLYTFLTGTYTFTFRVFTEASNTYNKPYVFINKVGAGGGSKYINKDTDEEGIGSNYRDWSIDIDVTAGSYPVEFFFPNSNGQLHYSTVTITKKAPSCTAPNHVDVTGTWHIFNGDDIELTARAYSTEGTSNEITEGLTYQWYKNGTEEGNKIAGATSATYTKSSCTYSDAGAYYCKISTSEGCETCSDYYDVKMLRVYVKNSKGGSDYGYIDLIDLGNYEAQGTIRLATGGKTYGFGVADGCTGYYGNTGTMTSSNCTDWSMDNGYDCQLTSTSVATYTFTVKYGSMYNTGTGNYIKVSVTYPSNNQTSGKIIYFDNSLVNWSNVHYRIGKSNHVDYLVGGMTDVPGTASLKKMTTWDYSGFEAWHICDNTGWTGNNNTIYRTYTNNDLYQISNSIEFDGGAITDAAVTIVPRGNESSDHYTGGESGVNNNCQFYYYELKKYLWTHTATITTPTNGTIQIAYNDEEHTDEANKVTQTTTTSGLAHTTKLYISTTPATGYEQATLTVNGSDFDASYHVLSADATIAATFKLIDYNVTYSAPSNGSYTISVAGGAASGATKTANMGQTITLAATPSSGYAFSSWTITRTDNSTDVTSSVSLSSSTNKDATFTMPAYEVTVTATFAETTCTNNKVIQCENSNVGASVTIINSGEAHPTPASATVSTDGDGYNGSGYLKMGSGSSDVGDAFFPFSVSQDNTVVTITVRYKEANAHSYANIFEKVDAATGHIQYNGAYYNKHSFEHIGGNEHWDWAYNFTDYSFNRTLYNKDYILVICDSNDGKICLDQITLAAGAGNDVFCEETSTTYDVTVNRNYDSYGTVTGANTYTAGETVTISATPESGYGFVNWTTSDGVTFADANSASTTFTMPSKNVTIQANFEPLRTIHFEVEGGNGTVSAKVKATSAVVSDGDQIASGTILTFTATPSSGYSVLGWYTYASSTETYQADTRATNTFDYELTSDMTIRVKFTKIRIATGDANLGSTDGYANSNDGSTIATSNVDDPEGKFNHKVLQVDYKMVSASDQTSYRGISLPVDNGYTTSIASGKAGMGFWYRTESTTDKVLTYFCIGGTDGSNQFENLLPATNGKWQYWYIETDKVDDNTTFGFYINGTKNSKSTGTINANAKFWLSEVEPITPADVTVLGDETKEIAPIVRDLTIYQGGEVTNTEDVIVTRNIYYHRHAKGGALSNKLDQWYTFAVPFTVTDIEVNESSTWYDINAVYYSNNNDNNQSGNPDGSGHFYLQYLSATNVSAMGSEFADRWRYITPDHSLYLDANAADWDGSRYGYPMKDSAYIILFDSTDPIGDYFDNNTEIRFVGGAQTIDGTAKEWKVESDGEEYYLYANNTLHNFTLTGSAYVLNDAGTNFDLQETPTIRPFECYVQGTNALKEKYQSLPMRRPGGGGIVTGMEKTGSEDSVQVIKVIEDGRLIIIRNGRHYNAMGARVK